MRVLSRRQFLKTGTGAGAALGLAAASVARARTNPLGLPIGSQTWPHRAMIRDGRFGELLKILNEIGVEEIELMSAIGWSDFAPLRDARAARRIIDDHGLTCVSTQVNIAELRRDQPASIAWAGELGLKVMIIPTFGGAPPATLDDVKRVADEYNGMAEVAARAGIQQGLHNEGFEVSFVNGRRTYDILLELLDPKLVKFEFQMSTLNYGLVGAEYFTRYPGRFIAMHLQDIDQRAPATVNKAGQPVHPQAPVGQGSIDWVRTFTAAKTGGVQHLFIEQTMEFTKESASFLKTLNV